MVLHCSKYLFRVILLGMIETQVITGSGPVSGIIEQGIYRYAGIPYAAPPTGSLRWQPPQPPVPWTEVRLLDDFGPACCQSMLGLDPAIKEVGEDCLYLNVWTPSIDSFSSLPVMVYLHGGGFARGTGIAPLYNRPYLSQKGIVLVTINYRLGALGFLAHPALSAESSNGRSGNYGLMDQIAALQWVRSNIRSFGGNPDNVTLFGQSAGGASVIALMSSPLSKGLFHRAIAQSCGYPSARIRHLRKDSPNLESMESMGLKFAAKLGLAHNTDIAAALRDRPWQEIVETWETSVQNVARGSGIAGAWSMNHVIVDGYVLTQSPGLVFSTGQQHNIPFMTGVTADEGPLLSRLFSIPSCDRYINYVEKRYGHLSKKMLDRYPAIDDSCITDILGNLIGDSFICAAPELATYMCAIQPQTYMYRFSAQPKSIILKIPGIEEYSGQFGSYHSAELPYIFNMLTKANDKDRYLSEQMMGYWSRFARDGNPNGGNSVFWPAYSPPDRKYINLDTSIEVRQEPLSEAQDFLKQLDKIDLTLSQD